MLNILTPYKGYVITHKVGDVKFQCNVKGKQVTAPELIELFRKDKVVDDNIHYTHDDFVKFYEFDHDALCEAAHLEYKRVGHLLDFNYSEVKGEAELSVEFTHYVCYKLALEGLLHHLSDNGYSNQIQDKSVPSYMEGKLITVTNRSKPLDAICQIAYMLVVEEIESSRLLRSTLRYLEDQGKEVSYVNINLAVNKLLSWGYDGDKDTNKRIINALVEYDKHVKSIAPGRGNSKAVFRAD